MAKGYASRTERKDEPDDLVVLDAVLDPALCVICKKRPGVKDALCGVCHDALRGNAGRFASSDRAKAR